MEDVTLIEEEGVGLMEAVAINNPKMKIKTLLLLALLVDRPPRVFCQICDRIGHYALDYYHCMDYAY